MKKIKNLRYTIPFFLLLIAVSSCNKNTRDYSDINNIPPGTRDQSTKDSIYLYAKELYYWNTALPSYNSFNPRSYLSNEDELYALSQLAINPLNGIPYEYHNGYEPKYSFIDYVITFSKSKALKAGINGSANDFGFAVMYNNTSDLRVKYVYPNSPAAQQGLTRGCQIIAVNNKTDLTNSSSNVSFLNDALFGANSSVDLTFVDLAGVTRTVTIDSFSYTINPILFTGVYTAGTKKVGYVVLNSFTDNLTNEFNGVFNQFSSQGINELVVDLRYNGGGYVSTAIQMINFIAPSAKSGQTMLTYYYNNFLQNLTTAQRKASVISHQPLLDNNGKLTNFTTGVNGRYATYADLDYKSISADNIEKFSKLGSLNLNRVYVIVGSGTASASELLINSLKPVIDVKLIGAQTYGKPVGFFPIRIDNLDLYIPEFEMKNQLGAGGYYAGISVDKQANEDLTKQWGDENETLLSYALLYAKTGSFVASAAKTASITRASTVMPNKLSTKEYRALEMSLDQNNFKGMFGTPSLKHR